MFFGAVPSIVSVVKSIIKLLWVWDSLSFVFLDSRSCCAWIMLYTCTDMCLLCCRHALHFPSSPQLCPGIPLRTLCFSFHLASKQVVVLPSCNVMHALDFVYAPHPSFASCSLHILALKALWLFCILNLRTPSLFCTPASRMSYWKPPLPQGYIAFSALWLLVLVPVLTGFLWAYYSPINILPHTHFHSQSQRPMKQPLESLTPTITKIWP